jgi:hypothetical protein
MLKRCLFASFVAGSFMAVACGSGAGGMPVAGETTQPPSGTDQSPPTNDQAPAFNSQGPGGVASGDLCDQLCAASQVCSTGNDNKPTDCVAQCRYAEVVSKLLGCDQQFQDLMSCAQTLPSLCTTDSACPTQTAAFDECTKNLDINDFGPTCTLPDHCGGCIQDRCKVCLCATSNDASFCEPICAGGTVVTPTPDGGASCTPNNGCADCANGSCEQCLCASNNDLTTCQQTGLCP